MNELFVLRYILQNQYYQEPFEAMNTYCKAPIPIIFDPCDWFAQHILEFKNSKSSKVILKNQLHPYLFIYNYENQSFSLISKFKCNDLQIARLAVEMLKNNEFKYTFPSKFLDNSYFSFHHDSYQLYKNNNYYLPPKSFALKPNTQTTEVTQLSHAKFYCEYGFWHNLERGIVNANIFIASIHKDYESEQDALNDYYNCNFGYPMTFCPYVFLASNKDLIDDFVNCKGQIDEDRVTTFYIRNYKLKKYLLDFDGMDYLANNVKRIKELMTISKQKIYWDINKLTPHNIAKIFVKHKGKQKVGIFKPTEFVKEYVDNFDFVNKDKKLSLLNASSYFVKAYVEYENIRHQYTNTYRALAFLQGRVLDSAKQIPFNAARFLIESRCV